MVLMVPEQVQVPGGDLPVPESSRVVIVAQMHAVDQLCEAPIAVVRVFPAIACEAVALGEVTLGELVFDQPEAEVSVSGIVPVGDGDVRVRPVYLGMIPEKAFAYPWPPVLQLETAVQFIDSQLSEVTLHLSQYLISMWIQQYRQEEVHVGRL